MPKGDKYIKLKKFLLDSDAPMIKLTYKQIEKIICASLPESASKHAEAWWSNNKDHSQAVAWLDAGYETDFESATYQEEAIVFVNQRCD